MGIFQPQRCYRRVMGRTLTHQEVMKLESQYTPMAVQRCTATSKSTGVRCRRMTGQPGMLVCHYHGGGSKLVRSAAERRVRHLLPLALQVLFRVLEEGNDRDALRAARYVMKYSGINPRNIQTEARSERTLKAIGRGTPTPPSDNEIEDLIALLMREDDDQEKRLEIGAGESSE